MSSTRTSRLAYYVTLENARGARSSDVVYAASYAGAERAAEARHPGYEVLELERDPDRDPVVARVAGAPRAR